MTKKRLYTLTEEGLAKLRTLPTFAKLTIDQQDTLAEYLQTALSDMNHVNEEVLHLRLGQIPKIIGQEADKQLFAEIQSSLCVEYPAD